MKSNIPGYPGYPVTKSGLVYSNKRGTWRIRKTSVSNTNRLRVRINNNVENLKWGTQSDNIQQAYTEKRITPFHLLVNGDKHPSTKITNQTRYLLVDLYLNYKVPIPKLSIIFGISKRHITKIISQYKSGIRWS